MKIGEVSKKTGLSIDTIRYYERRGLITRPQRRYSGYRIFEEKQVDELRFIKRAHQLGFTLSEIKQLMSLRQNCGRESSKVKQKVLGKYRQVNDKIQRLEKTRDQLFKLIDSINTHDEPNSLSPILQTMEPELFSCCNLK